MVFVIDADKKPLDMCHPARARKLLRGGKAAIYRTNVNASGFPRGYLARQKQFFGFQTGDMVKAVVTRGKKIGTYFGKVMCRRSGSFDIRTSSGRVQGINHRYFQLVQRSDGYLYSRKEVVALPPHG